MRIHAGERANRFRVHQGLTLQTLAQRARMKVSTLHRIIHGQQPARDYEIEALATALGVSMAEFYGALPESKAVEAS